jgi:hypothetical protein
VRACVIFIVLEQKIGGRERERESERERERERERRRERMRERDRERECRAETRIEAAARRSACPSPSACHAARLVRLPPLVTLLRLSWRSPVLALS